MQRNTRIVGKNRSPTAISDQTGSRNRTNELVVSDFLFDFSTIYGRISTVLPLKTTSCLVDAADILDF